MTIKQQGGVFGRNPAFNDVTIDGQLTFGGDIDVNSDLKVDGDVEVTGAITVGNSGAGAKVDVRTGSSEYAIRLENGTGMYFRVADGGLTEVGGNVKFLNAGNGIDFSATSGTGTSELFDDYEEGTWTPTDSSGGSLSLTVTAAAYTKIGRAVFASFDITYPSTSDTNYATLGGLPFVSKNNGSVSIGYTNESTLARGETGSSDDTTFSLYDTSGNLIQNSALSGDTIRATVIYYSA